MGGSYKEMVNRKKKMISNLRDLLFDYQELQRAQRASEMTQEVMVLDTKACYLSSNPRDPHGGKREPSISCPLMATCVPPRMFVPTYPQESTEKMGTRKLQN